MWILPLLGYVGIVSGFLFLTLAIASGLYYLSELVEEHTVLSKRILTRLIQIIVAIHVLLIIFDGFPFWLTLLSAASHGLYAMNLRKFPMVSLADGWFLGSCVLVITNHLLWFRQFSKPPEPMYSYSDPSSPANRHKHTYSSSLDYKPVPTFSEISAFFGLCVWLIPFALFVSLSAGENVLPSTADGVGSTSGSGSSNGIGGGGRDGKGKKGGRAGLLKKGIDSTWDYVVESGQALGVWNMPGMRRKSTFD